MLLAEYYGGSYLIANQTITFLNKPSISIGSYFPNIPKYSQPFEIGTLIFQPFYWLIIIHLCPFSVSYDKFQANKLIIYFRAAIFNNFRTLINIAVIGLLSLATSINAVTASTGTLVANQGPGFYTLMHNTSIEGVLPKIAL